MTSTSVDLFIYLFFIISNFFYFFYSVFIYFLFCVKFPFFLLMLFVSLHDKSEEEDHSVKLSQLTVIKLILPVSIDVDVMK